MKLPNVTPIRPFANGCESIRTSHVAPGWGCCNCHKLHGGATYNNIERTECKACGHRRCDTH